MEEWDIFLKYFDSSVHLKIQAVTILKRWCSYNVFEIERVPVIKSNGSSGDASDKIRKPVNYVLIWRIAIA
jgi:hypothetical protein